MSLLIVTGIVALGTAALLGALLVVCVGPSHLSAPLREPEVFKRRLYNVAPFLVVLVLVLGINKGLHDVSQDISWVVGQNVTGVLYGIEGEFLIALQNAFPEQAAFYFSFIYVFGYVALLVFPMIAYLFSDSLHNLKVTLIAYAANYGIGVLMYTLFIAYGPRNVMDGLLSQPMYEVYPEVMFLTSAVNTNTNVFPSLHTSLSVTAMILALMSHREFPRWTPFALLLGTSVVISTMYLGIHWLTDVVVGVALGALAVYIGEYVVNRADRSGLLNDLDDDQLSFTVSD
ncbi:phosphatase PAP2 family protein [Natranaeroarchaeum sulfidigenes]|nr:phosphatase PAP2 family protein [Natranaeroarchaeum sulfidigenes]